MQTQCPVCDANFAAEETVEIAEIIACRECQNKLEVVNKNIQAKTLEVREAPHVEEDWGE